jgi:hypothetical protein
MSDKIPDYPHFDEKPEQTDDCVVIWETSTSSPNNHFLVSHWESGCGKRLVLYENKPCGGKATVVCSDLIDATMDQLKAAFALLEDEWIEIDRSADGVTPFEATRCTAVVTIFDVTVVELTITHRAMPGLPTDMTQDRMRAFRLTKAHLAVVV